MIATRGAQDAAALDQAGFVALVEPVLPAAYQLARAMLRSEIEAEDAVQEGVLSAWRHHHRFVAGLDMKPWLLAIVANECRRMRRSRWWSVVKWPAHFEADQLPPAAADQDLRKAIDRLPDDQKLAVTLRYYLDLPFEDVARVMKTSTKAAKSRTYRALERLRLDPEVIGDERD